MTASPTVGSNAPGRRLLSQRIASEPCPTPAAVVRRMGAMQAQDYKQAVWAIGLRTRGEGADGGRPGTLAEVEQAIAAGSILRTWPMRGTIHFVPAEDARWMLRLTAERHLARDGRRLAQLGLDERDMARCRELFAAALAGGRRLSRAAMMGVLEAAGIATAGQRGYHALWHAAQSGLVCFGPMDGKEQTFVLLDEWVPSPRTLEGEEALAELARRFFAARGPATVRDFAWWAGVTLTEARTGLAGARPRLARVVIAGVEHWLAEDAAEPDPAEVDIVHLLPGFDEFLLGYQDRTAVLPAAHAGKVVPGNNGIFKPTIADRGGVLGTWQASVKRGAVIVTLAPFAPDPALADRAADAAAGYARFLGLPLAAVETAPVG
jgi:hypothetical protein